LKFAFSSNAFRRYSLVETIRILAGIGYDALEIMADAPHAYPPDLSDKDIRIIRQELSRTGLGVSNINAFMLHAEGNTWHPSWIEKEKRLRARRIDHTFRCIDLAKELGVPYITTEPGGPLDGLERREGIRLFMEGLSAVREKALQSGIQVLIEPEPGLLIENSRQFRSLMEGLDPEAFGLNFDIGHFFCVGEDPVALIQEMGDHIRHFHFEDIAVSREHHHLMPGEGAMDLFLVLDVIQNTGYKGYVTVELYNYEDRAVEAATKAFEYLCRWREARGGESRRRPAAEA
jgi:sugar phosphate isomerase/epimerase